MATDNTASAINKISFTSYSSPDCTAGTEISTITAHINPDNFQLKRTAEYGSTPESGSSEKTLICSNVDSILSLQNLIVDGTGIVKLDAKYADVDAYLTALRGVVMQYNGAIHSMAYVNVTWGASLNFKGLCTSYNTKYILFTPDGIAKRASVDMQFRGSTSIATKTAQESNSSPDLTHVRVVKAGDTLPLLTYRIYGDSSYYLEIARINKLNHINAIKPGDNIYFPPLKK